MTSPHPALDDLHAVLIEVKEALKNLEEAIDEGLRLLEVRDGHDDRT